MKSASAAKVTWVRRIKENASAATVTWVLVGVLAMCGIVVMNIESSLRPQKLRYHRPDGYTRIVNLLIRHEYFSYNRASGKVEFAPEDSVMQSFRENSYLDGDLAAFNSGRDRAVFRIIGNRVVSIDALRHRMPLPFSADGRRWLGDVTYRPDSRRQAELVGAGGSAVLTTPTRTLQDASSDNELLLCADGSVCSPQDSPLDVVKLRTSNHEILGKAFLLGNCIVVNNRTDRHTNRLLVNGLGIRQGRSCALSPGDVLLLQWRDGKTRDALLYSRVLPEAPLVSTVRNINGRERAVTVSPDLSLADAVRRDMGAMMADLGNGAKGVRETDVRLTMSRRIHEATQDILEQWSKERRKDGRFFRAAVTIMDARTGEVLALASYPTKRQLDESSLDDDRRADLLMNHNLSRRPIGSVAKIPFAAAIIAEYPELATLQIPASGDTVFPQILGISVESAPLHDHVHWGDGDGWIDFHEFVVNSVNRYAAILMTLATAGRTPVDGAAVDGPLPLGVRDPYCLEDSLGPKDVFRVGGQTYRNRPEVRFALHPLHQQVDGTDLVSYARSVELEHLSFVDNLESCFGVLASIEDHPDSEDSRSLLGTDHVDTGPWRYLTEHFYPASHWTEERQGAMLHSSPERVNLSLNLVDDYRREYLPLILGSGYSRWTNVAVCQVFSRLLTGKAVEARFVYDLESPPVSLEQPEWPDAGIPERARATMLQAMQDVPRYGTAKELYTTIRTINSRWASQGYRAGVFGKTGTPALVVYETQERTKALNNLIETQALHVSPADGYIHYRDSGPILDEDDVSAALAAIRASSGDASAFAALDSKWGKLALDRCRWYNERSARDRAFLFEVENGVLVRALGSTEDMTHGAAFAFVFGRYPEDSATGSFGVRSLAEPERALAVSVIFEKRGMSSGDIMPLVSKLMQEVMVDALEAGW